MSESWEEADSLLFRAANFRWLCGKQRHTAALQIISDKGISLVIEFPGDGARNLRECVRKAFEAYPEMNEWTAPKPH